MKVQRHGAQLPLPCRPAEANAVSFLEAFLRSVADTCPNSGLPGVSCAGTRQRALEIVQCPNLPKSTCLVLPGYIASATLCMLAESRKAVSWRALTDASKSTGIHLCKGDHAESPYLRLPDYCNRSPGQPARPQPQRSRLFQRADPSFWVYV